MHKIHSQYDVRTLKTRIFASEVTNNQKLYKKRF